MKKELYERIIHDDGRETWRRPVEKDGEAMRMVVEFSDRQDAEAWADEGRALKVFEVSIEPIETYGPHAMRWRAAAGIIPAVRDALKASVRAIVMQMEHDGGSEPAGAAMAGFPLRTPKGEVLN